MEDTQDYAVAPYKGKQTGEVALFRQLVGQLKAGDIFLADAIFENYFLLALLQAEGIDAVCEKNGTRHVDFRQCDQKPGKKGRADSPDKTRTPRVDEP